MIVQHQNEAASSPIMTTLTTGCAVQNMESSVVSGVSFMSGGASLVCRGFGLWLRLTASVGSGRALMRRKWAETLVPQRPVPTPAFYRPS